MFPFVSSPPPQPSGITVYLVTTRTCCPPAKTNISLAFCGRNVGDRISIPRDVFIRLRLCCTFVSKPTGSLWVFDGRVRLTCIQITRDILGMSHRFLVSWDFSCYHLLRFQVGWLCDEVDISHSPSCDGSWVATALFLDTCLWGEYKAIDINIKSYALMIFQIVIHMLSNST